MNSATQMEENETNKSKTNSAMKDAVLSSLRNVTPVRLGLLLFTNFSLAALFCFVAVSTLKQHEHAVKIIGLDASPSVIASYKIKCAVSAMDADLQGQLLRAKDSEELADLQSDFNKWRDIACTQLVASARNITYKREQELIENIQMDLAKYQMQAQEARDLHFYDKKEAALLAYRASLRTAEDELLPDAEALEKINSDVLEATYAQEKSATNLSRGFVLVMGMLTLCMLLYTQFFLYARFRRRICPPVFLALIALMFLINNLNASLTENSKAMKLAKEDSYDSVLALLHTRAEAYEASAAVGRVLLQKEESKKHETRYINKRSSIARFENNQNFEKCISETEKEIKEGKRLSLANFSGSLAEELHNVCFPGEVEAALDAIKNFAKASESLDRVLSLLKEGDENQALQKYLSFAPSGCKLPLSQFDDALMRTLKINEEQLEKAVQKAFHSLDGLIVEVDAISILTVVCVYLGLLPRMEEYVHRRPSPYTHSGRRPH